MKLIRLTAILILTAATTIAADIADSLIKVSTTLQSYNPSQPWEKTTPRKRRGLGAILKGNHILTTAEMVANVNFIELETTDGTNNFPAKVTAVDYEANLALLTPSTEEGREALKKLTPLEVSPPAKLEDPVEVIQIESNGMPLVTQGKILGADVISTFISDQFFLAYEIKASMQGASNSFTIPVLHKGKLLGLLTSYSSDDQLLDIIAPEIISKFLADAQDGEYTGFPSLGVATTTTTDTNFRQWLKLDDQQGGLYVTRTQPDSPAQKAGLKGGDVILAIDGNTIDRRGYYDANGYGKLYWTNLIRGQKTTGDQVKITILRDGKTTDLNTTLERSPEGIIPSHSYGKAPRYLVKGGLIFQELNSSYLKAFGKDWTTRAPINLLDALNHPEDYEKGRKRIVFLSAVIPTPATVGYEKINSAIIQKVNGQPIEDIPSLIKAFAKSPENGIHTIQLDGAPHTIYLDATTSDAIDAQLLQRGLPSLSREAE